MYCIGFLMPSPPFINLHNSFEPPCLQIFPVAVFIFIFNTFISILVFVSSSNTAFPQPFWIFLFGVMMSILLLKDLNSYKAATLEDMVSPFTLSKADIPTVLWYFDTSFGLISFQSPSWYSIVYYLFSASYLMILPIWLNRLNFFRIVVTSGYVLLSSLIGTILVLILWQRLWFVGVVFAPLV